MSKIVFRSFQSVIKEGQRLKIIKLENYNSAKELSIEKGNTESLGLIRHQDTGPTVRELWWLSAWREEGCDKNGEQGRLYMASNWE